MAIKAFINLAVDDLNRSVDFFTKLGFAFDAQFTDEKATCMILNDNCFVMLLTRPFFQTFTPHTAVDARTATESIIALSADSKDAVDELVKNAIQAGATTFEEPGDQGFMYSWSFQDLDGHIWEVVWMDPSMLDV